MGTLDRVVAQVLPYVPRKWVGRVSSRYIAGEDLESAIAAVAHLNTSGTRGTVDILGEFIGSLDEAEQAKCEYMQLLQALAARRLDSQASVKLTQLGLKLDPEVCTGHVRELVREAEKQRNLVTLDMEDSSCTDATLDLFTVLRRESAHVGAVLQACLRRSAADLDGLLALEPNIRVCKGIYIEPPELAYTNRDDIRRSFVALVERVLTTRGFVGIATHDEVLVERCCELVRKHGADASRFEFQMLMGVREELRRRLRDAGYPMRVYVPYGRHWYAYSMRRLKENPAIAGHVLRNLFERSS